MSNRWLVPQPSQFKVLMTGLSKNLDLSDQINTVSNWLAEQINHQIPYHLNYTEPEIIIPIEEMDFDSLIKVANGEDVNLSQEALDALKSKKTELADLSIYDMRNYKPVNVELKRLFASELENRIRSNNHYYLPYRTDFKSIDNFAISIHWWLRRWNSSEIGFQENIIFSNSIITPEDLLNDSLSWKDGVSFLSTINWELLIYNHNIPIEFIVRTLDKFPWPKKSIQNNPNSSVDNIHLFANYVKDWYSFIKEKATIEFVQRHPELMKNDRYLTYSFDNRPIHENQYLYLGENSKFNRMIADPNGTAIFIAGFIQNPNVTEEFIKSVPNWDQVRRFINQINDFIVLKPKDKSDLKDPTEIYSPGLSYKFITEHSEIKWSIREFARLASENDLIHTNKSIFDKYNRYWLTTNTNLTADVVKKYSIKISTDNPIINLRNLIDQLKDNFSDFEKINQIRIYLATNPNLRKKEFELFEFDPESKMLSLMIGKTKLLISSTDVAFDIGKNSLDWDPDYISVVKNEIKRLLTD